ncbi:hypothetical protein [Thermoflavimicrobium daqui]|jgi:hypothetical protein|uniref:Uncharacterized protein n=1 Tax=Thermoflavimicrobium daqui TaxID=2137476 RepID=A0A364K5W4_9BACL|nr:hypothetical protein [Thermoflavimicrobium daqui]RAL25580.1 hypothetical protein DL897_05730 [Thermoflavimicrobium daqui]
MLELRKTHPFQPSKWANFLRLLVKGCLIFLLALIGWIGFIFLQQKSHSEPDQVYIMGTVGSYIFLFLFLVLLFYFIFSFFALRQQAERLKRKFYIFVVFYLITSPLVLLSFDNYLLVTTKGIQYNSFFSVEGEPLKEWKQIEKLVLDYEVKQIPTQTSDDLRLRYILYFRDGSTVDLNHLNSPLYKRSEFITIHRVLLKYKVPIQIIRPLPNTFKDQSSFIYKLFHHQYQPSS